MKKDKKKMPKVWGCNNWNSYNRKDNKPTRRYLFRHPIRYISSWFRDAKILLKSGHNYIGYWDTDAWFIDVMIEILTWHRYCRWGSPCIRAIKDLKGDECHEIWNKELDQAIEWLKIMQKADYGLKEYSEAKEKFFTWFKENLEDLWD